MAKNQDLISSFQEFKEFKNIDRETLMRILEEVFRSALAKHFGSEDNFDIIVNIDKGDLEIFRNRMIVEDGAVQDPTREIAISDALKIEDDFSEYDEEMVPGATVHLNDEQAELYVHSRMEIGDGSNESRMRRQRTYMEALMAQCKEEMGRNKSFPNDLWEDMKDYATTNIPGNRVSAIANLVYKTEDLGIYDIEGEHTEGQLPGDKQAYIQFYADEESIVKIFKDLIGLGEGHEY